MTLRSCKPLAASILRRPHRWPAEISETSRWKNWNRVCPGTGIRLDCPSPISSIKCILSTSKIEQSDTASAVLLKKITRWISWFVFQVSQHSCPAWTGICTGLALNNRESAKIWRMSSSCAPKCFAQRNKSIQQPSNSMCQAANSRWLMAGNLKCISCTIIGDKHWTYALLANCNVSSTFSEKMSGKVSWIAAWVAVMQFSNRWTWGFSGCI